MFNIDRAGAAADVRGRAAEERPAKGAGLCAAAGVSVEDPQPVVRGLSAPAPTGGNISFYSTFSDIYSGYRTIRPKI